MTARVRRARTAAALALSAALVAALTGCSDDPQPSRAGRSTPTASASTSPVTPTASSPEATKLSAKEQADLNSKLIAAAWKNDVPRARALINAGADVNHKDASEQSAYLIATSEGYLDLLELTLRNGGDVRSLDGFRGTGLIRAADRGHADIVGRLLQTEIDVDHVNNLGWTALHEAIILGNGSQRYVDTVRLLVAGGADVELAPVRDGIPPIQHARSRGYAAITSTLRGALDTRRPRNPDRSLLRAAAAGSADDVGHRTESRCRSGGAGCSPAYAVVAGGRQRPPVRRPAVGGPGR